jgi:hypothetical protein
MSHVTRCIAGGMLVGCCAGAGAYHVISDSRTELARAELARAEIARVEQIAFQERLDKCIAEVTRNEYWRHETSTVDKITLCKAQIQLMREELPRALK